jgi:hypothetical protein
MNKLFACLALAFVAPIFGSLYADDEGGPPEQYEPPPPVGMDVDYLAPPKQKLSIGFRILTGPKVSFSGSGIIPAANPAPDVNGIRTYADGSISPDARTDAASAQLLANSPNPDPISRTNTWSFDNASQIDAAHQGVDMDTYGGTINGNNAGSGRAASGNGVELTFERDFGWHLGRVQFDLIGGLGLNKISFSSSAQVAGMMTKNTDVYNTYNTILDANGDPVLDANNNPTYTAGTPANGAPNNGSPPVAVTTPYTAPSTANDTNGTSEDNSALIGTSPVPGLSTTSAPVPTEVTEQSNIVGAYYTLRFGPQMTVPITAKFSASLSGGPALVYVGTKFTVNQTINPPTGNPVTSTVSGDYNTVLPAYFADADISYTLTDTTGLYLGAVFQSSRGYNQSISSPDGSYTDKVNFGNQEGVRAGINFKF